MDTFFTNFKILLSSIAQSNICSSRIEKMPLLPRSCKTDVDMAFMNPGPEMYSVLPFVLFYTRERVLEYDIMSHLVAVFHLYI